MLRLLARSIRPAGYGIFVAAFVAACSDSTGAGSQPQVDTLIVTSSVATLSPAEAASFAVVARTAGGTAVATAISWTTSDAAVLSVDANGTVTAVAPGTATVTASGGGKQTVSPVTVVRSWKSIAAGDDAVCAIAMDDRAWCWGKNGFGELGNGTQENSDTLSLVAGGALWRSLTSGYHSKCGITTDGQALCWGSDVHSGVAGTLLPTPIPGAPAFQTVAAGQFHNCGLTPAGAASCWGQGDFGELGDGNMPAYMPTAVTVAGGHVWKSISPGGLGVTCGLTSDGTAYCWGQGFLGTPMVQNSTPALVNGGHVFDTLAATFNGACALDASGQAWCWGQADFGTVGVDSLPASVPNPTAVSGNLRFTQLSAGGTAVCGLTATGDAYCWGQPNGLSNNCGETCSRPTAVPGGHKFVSISVGGAHVCGVTVGGAAWCWGDPPFGDGNFAPSDMPVRVGHPPMSSAGG